MTTIQLMELDHFIKEYQICAATEGKSHHSIKIVSNSMACRLAGS